MRAFFSNPFVKAVVVTAAGFVANDASLVVGVHPNLTTLAIASFLALLAHNTLSIIAPPETIATKVQVASAVEAAVLTPENLHATLTGTTQGASHG